MNAENFDSIDVRVFSASLTGLPDDVSQWRSYASDGYGVALGFDIEQISTLKVPYYKQDKTGEPTDVPIADTDGTLSSLAVLGKAEYGAQA